MFPPFDSKTPLWLNKRGGKQVSPCLGIMFTRDHVVVRVNKHTARGSRLTSRRVHTHKHTYTRAHRHTVWAKLAAAPASGQPASHEIAASARRAASPAAPPRPSPPLARLPNRISWPLSSGQQGYGQLTAPCLHAVPACTAREFEKLVYGTRVWCDASRRRRLTPRGEGGGRPRRKCLISVPTPRSFLFSSRSALWDARERG